LKARYKCSWCGTRYAISGTLPLCEVCAYAEATSREKAEHQARLAEEERERKAEFRKAEKLRKGQA